MPQCQALICWNNLKRGFWKSGKDDDYYDENADDDAASERGNTGDGKGDNKVSNVLTCLTALYLCTQMCHTALCYTTMCHTSLFLLYLCQCLDVQDLVTHWVSPTRCPQQFQRFIWLDPEFRKPFFGQKGETDIPPVNVRRWEEEPSWSSVGGL